MKQTLTSFAACEKRSRFEQVVIRRHELDHPTAAAKVKEQTQPGPAQHLVTPWEIEPFVEVPGEFLDRQIHTVLETTNQRIKEINNSPNPEPSLEVRKKMLEFRGRYTDNQEKYHFNSVRDLRKRIYQQIELIGQEKSSQPSRDAPKDDIALENERAEILHDLQSASEGPTRPMFWQNKIAGRVQPIKNYINR